MVMEINENCVSCGACEGECAFDAIYMGDSQYHIDPDKCTDCGGCQEACPSGAIQEKG